MLTSHPSEEEVNELKNRIGSSKIVIHFNGKYLQDIMLKGYKHWSALERTNNTQDVPNFVQRLESERNLFGINWYNDNVLKHTNEMLIKNKGNLISNWNERFEKSYKEEDVYDAKALFKKTGFERVKNDVEYGVVFGCLYDRSGKLIQGSKALQTTKYMDNTYGKSQIIVDQEALVQSKIAVTAAFGDTFDATPLGCAWKNNGQYPASSVLFLISNPDQENITTRIKTQPSDFPYVEAHIFKGNLGKGYMKEIKLNKNEYFSSESNTQEALSDLRSLNPGKIVTD